MSESLKVTGRIVKLGPVESRGAKGFRVAQMVIEIDGQKYGGTVPFEASKKALEGYDALRVGDVATVHFNLSGREWNGKHYVNLDAWRIERPGAERREEVKFDPAMDEEEGVSF